MGGGGGRRPIHPCLDPPVFVMAVLCDGGPESSIAGTLEALFVLVSKEFFKLRFPYLWFITFKPNFVYSFQINCKIMDTNLH